jgi:hypothetical protein
MQRERASAREQARVVMSPRALEAAQAGQLRLVADAVRAAGSARVLATVATLDERQPLAEVLKRLRELAEAEPLLEPVRTQRSLQAAVFLFQFAEAQLSSAATGAGLVIPARVAQAMSRVLVWTREITAPPAS